MKCFAAKGLVGTFFPDINTYVHHHNNLAYFSDSKNSILRVEGKKLVKYEMPTGIPYGRKKNAITWFEDWSDEVIISTKFGFRTQRMPPGEYLLVKLNDENFLGWDGKNYYFYDAKSLEKKRSIEVIDGYLFFKFPPFVPVSGPVVEHIENADFVVGLHGKLIELTDEIVGMDMVQNARVKTSYDSVVLFDNEFAYVAPVKVDGGIGLIKCEIDEFPLCIENADGYDVLKHVRLPGIVGVSVDGVRSEKFTVNFAGDYALIRTREGDVKVHWDANIFDVVEEYGVEILF